jgi:hypothetical protein
MRDLHELSGEEVLEDITGQTGWMYTDLFVGLMVIFLATITFIPVGSIFISNKAVQVYSEIYPTPVAFRYSSFDYSKIKSDIADFQRKNGYEINARIVNIEIIGSYDPKSESPNDAINRALGFNKLLTLASIENPIFQGTSTKLRYAPDTLKNDVVVKFTFSRMVQVVPSK